VPGRNLRLRVLYFCEKAFVGLFYISLFFFEIDRRWTGSCRVTGLMSTEDSSEDTCTGLMFYLFYLEFLDLERLADGFNDFRAFIFVAN
jgi:hypothetical protein